MEPSDLVVADKGFLIQYLMPADVNLNLPPFLAQGWFSKEQAELTVTIVRARIHVERAIRRMKCFSILDFIPHTYRLVFQDLSRHWLLDEFSETLVEGSGELILNGFVTHKYKMIEYYAFYVVLFLLN